MEWSKLKNIIILILLAVNLCLLALMIGRTTSQFLYADEGREDVVTILESHGIVVDEETLPEELELSQLLVHQDKTWERTQAEGLLGTLEESESGTSFYQGERGTVRFSSDGTFAATLQPGAFVAETPGLEAATALDCLAVMGFQGELVSWDEEGQTMQIRQTWEGVPIFSCVATVTWEDGEVRQMEGTRLVGMPSMGTRQEWLTVNTILLRFADYLRTTGTVSQTIYSLTPGYALSGTQVPPHMLSPTWLISTDSGTYYVDGYSGVVSVAE